MATALLSRPTVTYALIRNAVESNENSKKYISELISITIGFILYQRTNLDRRDFAKFICNGLVCHSFKKPVQNLYIRQVRKWILGAIDAFQKSYLKELYVIFTDKFNTEILETYKLEFTYHEDNVETDKLLVAQNLREATNNLFLSISKLDMEKLKTDEFLLGVCLIYNDNVPADYKPPYSQNNAYKQHDNIMLENFLKLDSNTTTFGCVDTSFHLVQTDFQIDQGVQNISDESDTATETVISVEAIESDTFEDTDEESKRNTDSENKFMFLMKINCNCLIQEKFINIEVVECSRCACLQHIPCLGFLYSYKIREPYICESCINNCSTPVTVEEQFISSFRFVLAFIYFNHYFPYIIINSIPEIFAQKIIVKLQNMQLINCIDKMYRIKDDINSVIESYFLRKKRSNNKSDTSNKKKKFF